MNPLISFFLAFALALVLTPLVRYIAKSSNIVSRVKEDRWRREPVPLMGGASLWITFTVLALLSGKISYEIIIILLCSTGIFLLGFIDDVFGLNPQFKLIGQIIISSILILAGIQIKIIPYPVISIPLTILWVVGITNAFNLLDNMDGLSAGIACIASILIFIFSMKHGNLEVAFLSVIITGASLGFLWYNFNPASIFMGDCGSMFLGFLLAVLSILGTWHHATNLVGSLLVPLLVLGIPIFDTSFVTISRKIKGLPVSQGGKDHISHRLVSLGLSERKAVIYLYLFSCVIGVTTLFLIDQPFILIVIGLIIAIGLYALGIFLGEKDTQIASYEEPDIIVKKRSLKARPTTLSKRRIMEILIDLVLITVAYFSSYLLRYDGVMSDINMALFVNTLPWIIMIKFLVFSYMGLYESIWRYIGIRDVINIVKATVLSSLIIVALILMYYRFRDFSRAVFIIDGILTLFLVGGVRLIILVLREYLENYREDGKRIVIVGAGDAGEMVLREIRNNRNLGFRVIGFLDDNPKKHQVKIHGIKVLGDTADLIEISKEKQIDEVLIAIPSATKEAISRITDLCRNAGIKYGMFPEMKKLLDQERSDD